MGLPSWSARLAAVQQVRCTSEVPLDWMTCSQGFPSGRVSAWPHCHLPGSTGHVGQKDPQLANRPTPGQRCADCLRIDASRQICG